MKDEDKINVIGCTNWTIGELRDHDKYDHNDPKSITIAVLKKDVENYNKHLKNFEECIKNEELIKYYYNHSTTLETIKQMVKRYEHSKNILDYLKISY